MPNYDEKAILIGAGIVGIGVLAYAMTRKKANGSFLVGGDDNRGIEFSDGCLPKIIWGGFPYNITDGGAYANFRRQVVASVAQDTVAAALPAGPGLAAPIDATAVTDTALSRLGGGACPGFRNMPDNQEYERLREFWAGLHADVVAQLRAEVEQQQNAGGTGFVYDIQGTQGNV